MSFYKKWRQPQIGGVASRILTQQARPALADARVQIHEPAALHDAPIDTYEELDPVGAGRPIAP